MANSNLQQRIVSGIIGAAVIFSGILFSDWSYMLINIGIALLGLNEFYQLCQKAGHKVSYWLGMGLALALNLATYFVLKEEIHPLTFSVGFPLVLVIFVVTLFDKTEKSPMMTIGLTFLGIVYVVLPFCLAHGIVIHAARSVLMGIILLVWGNDIGAYFAGKHLGKHKLFERISPKKTWEGFIGGALLVFVATFFMHYFIGILTLADWIILGLIISPVATFGDLVESMIKRSLNIKDSGGIMPGHGGMLDRIDSLLFVFPVATTFILLWLSLHWI
jgi:phosphatidate cytidylyltransferase